MEAAFGGRGPRAGIGVQTVIEPPHGWAALGLDGLWVYRELLYFLVWRDVKVRYKQTALGAAWVVLQPIMNMLVFTFLFGNLLKVPSGGAPYAIFSFSALLPWTFFASSLGRSSTSLVGSSNLITKVYFPRLVIPIAAVLAGLVDFAVSFLVLVGLMVHYHVVPTGTALWMPLFLLMAILNAIGFGLWLSALDVRFRDVMHLVPFALQVWMYVTPVIYGSGLLPERYRFFMVLNPMAGVVEGFRWALLGARLSGTQAPGGPFLVSTLITLVVLVTGTIYFRHVESSFADVI
jgi:lipopolysaccharide transport system permease protein